MTDTRSPAQCASATGLRDAALAYAGGGHRVFPVHPARKQPLRARPEEGDEPLPLADWQDPTKGGFHAGVCDEHLVRMWWAIQYRGAGIGYSIPPNVFVLDDDNGDGMERLRAIRPDLADELWECGAIVQSRRGRHYYFSVRGHLRAGRPDRLRRAPPAGHAHPQDLRCQGRGGGLLDPPPDRRQVVGTGEPRHHP